MAYDLLQYERYYRYCKRCLHGPPMHGLQLRPCSRLLFVWDITITFTLLHVPYKSELIITQMSLQTSIKYNKG